MTAQILDQISFHRSTFRPETTHDYFGLQLARKLNESEAARHYAFLAAEHSEDQLVRAYFEATKQIDGDRGRRFHMALEHVKSNGGSPRNAPLVAVRVERRSIGVAIFDGTRIEYTQTRQLSSVREKAIFSAIDFTNWVLETFPVQTGVIEPVLNVDALQRQALTQAVRLSLRESAASVWEVARPELFEAFGFPGLRSRRELREVVSTIWPVIAGKNNWCVQDAAALGLYVQTERLFIN